MDNEQIFYVKRLRLLNKLISLGFTDYTVIPDPTSHKGYNWFVFKRTPEFDEAVNEYFAQFNN